MAARISRSFSCTIRCRFLSCCSLNSSGRLRPELKAALARPTTSAILPITAQRSVRSLGESLENWPRSIYGKVPKRNARRTARSSGPCRAPTAPQDRGVSRPTDPGPSAPRSPQRGRFRLPVTWQRHAPPPSWWSGGRAGRRKSENRNEPDLKKTNGAGRCRRRTLGLTVRVCCLRFCPAAAAQPALNREPGAGWALGAPDRGANSNRAPLSEQGNATGRPSPPCSAALVRWCRTAHGVEDGQVKPSTALVRETRGRKGIETRLGLFQLIGPASTCSSEKRKGIYLEMMFPFQTQQLHKPRIWHAYRGHSANAAQPNPCPAEPAAAPFCSLPRCRLAPQTALL